MQENNYFTQMNLEPAVEVDQQKLQQQYLAAQRQFHPDRFVGKPEAEKQAAFEKSSELNEIYATLKNRMKRLEYLLKISGRTEFSAPQELLMEIMELREEHQENPQIIEKQVNEEIEQLFAKAALDFKAGKVDDVAATYTKIKYLQNVTANT